MGSPPAYVICNIVLFGFTSLVLLVDGPPNGAKYIVFTLWLVVTLVLSSLVISRGGARGNVMKVVAILFNIVLLGFTSWAFVDQYPHPRENGFIAFIVLMVLTPILNLVVLFRSRARDG